MIFNDHSKLVGQHAFLGASSYHWLNYDEQTLIQRYKQQYGKMIGTILHNFASECIKNHIKLSKSQDKHMITLELVRNGIPNEFFDADDILETLAPFVNDAIGFKMTSEQVLYYSENCFGTADVISFRNNVLRIHDYKSGSIPAHMEQLIIYAALFCLEYNIKPSDISEIELRIYQNGEVLFHKPTSEEIEEIITKIVDDDRIIDGITNKKVVA